MIDGHVFDQQVKSDQRTFDDIQNIATGQRDDYTTNCLLEYIHFKNYYKIITIDLSKQKAFDVNP